jgi:hypothetical protein
MQMTTRNKQAEKRNEFFTASKILSEIQKSGPQAVEVGGIKMVMAAQMERIE